MKDRVNLVIPCDIFDSLIDSLSYFISAENQTGETLFSIRAKKLKNKIMEHGRIFRNRKTGDAETVSILFFNDEVIRVVKLLIYYISLVKPPKTSYFVQFEQHNSDKKRRWLADKSKAKKLRGALE